MMQKFVMDVHTEIYLKYGWLVDIQACRGGYLCNLNLRETKKPKKYQIMISEDVLGPARIVDFMEAFKKELKEKYPELLL